MRQMRLAVTLLLALVLCAQGLVAHAARAHRAAAALSAADLCIPAPDGRDQHHERDCLSHCLAAFVPASAPPPGLAHLAVPAVVPIAAAWPTAAGPRLAHVFILDHAPRAPPAAA